MRYFVKLPNDLWGIYSTEEGYVLVNATLKELYDFRVDEQLKIIDKEINSLETDEPLVNIGNYLTILLNRLRDFESDNEEVFLSLLRDENFTKTYLDFTEITIDNVHKFLDLIKLPDVKRETLLNRIKLEYSLS